MHNRPNRMPPIPVAEMTPAQRVAAEEIASGPRGTLRGPFIPMIRSPEFMRRAQKLGEYLRFDNALPTAIKEFIILVIAGHHRQAYEWHVHCPLALKAGVTREIVVALSEGSPLQNLSAQQQAAYEFCQQLMRNCYVEDAGYEAMKAQFGEQGVMDLIGMVGYYTMLAMILNTAHSPLPDGAPAAFSVPDSAGE
ncbi:MAG: carboxymuconolactone decarboxylase family protein [Steroidobacteraceae bacterium]